MDEEATHTLHKYSFSACRRPKRCLLIVFSPPDNIIHHFLVNSREKLQHPEIHAGSLVWGVKLLFLSLFVSVQVNQHCLFLFRRREENNLFRENRRAAGFFWNDITSSRLLKLRNYFICLQVEIEQKIFFM